MIMFSSIFINKIFFGCDGACNHNRLYKVMKFTSKSWEQIPHSVRKSIMIIITKVGHCQQSGPSLWPLFFTTLSLYLLYIILSTYPIPFVCAFSLVVFIKPQLFFMSLYIPTPLSLGFIVRLKTPIPRLRKLNFVVCRPLFSGKFTYTHVHAYVYIMYKACLKTFARLYFPFFYVSALWSNPYNSENAWATARKTKMSTTLFWKD